MGRLGTETAMAISVEASAHAAAGNRVFPFHLGDLNLPTPAPVREAARAALEAGHTGYCPAAGIPPLREALAADVGGARGLDYGANNVSIQPGGKPTIGKYIAAMMEHGETVLYPNPGYPIYESQIEFFGGVAHPYGYVDTKEGLRLDFDAVEAGIAAGARHLFYNNYNNPTGASSPSAEMEQLAQLTEYYGFDKPLPVAYASWLWDVVRLDFGESFRYSEPVLRVIGDRLPVSIYYGLITAFLTYGICIPLGILKAIKHRTNVDNLTSILIFVGYAVPGFALGAVLSNRSRCDSRSFHSGDSSQRAPRRCRFSLRWGTLCGTRSSR